jgi:membrane associated rhomboid family serine protease
MFPIRDHNPSGRTPYVTWSLIAINIAVFLMYWPFMPSEQALSVFYEDWGLVPAYVTEGHHLPGLVTSMFLHGGWMHLLGNMLFLFIFGDNMEDRMGHVPFALFYLVAGFAAGGLQILADPRSMIPMVGASGAIAGVMGGSLLLFPKARVDIFVFFIIIFRIFPIPAWIMLGLWFALQVVNGVMTPSDTGGVAHWAHAGGFVAGLVLTMPLWLRLGGTAFWNRTHGHPPHPVARYALGRSRVPNVRRMK